MSNFFKHKMRGKSPGEIIGMILAGIIFIGGLAILFGFVIMWLWNWLMPMIFGLTTLTFWQAVGVFILAKILLGGCGGFGESGKSSSKSDKCKTDGKGSFSKWKYYDEFWKAEGNNAFNDFIERKQTQSDSNE